jgi:hypothetical protein
LRVILQLCCWLNTNIENEIDDPRKQNGSTFSRTQWPQSWKNYISQTHLVGPNGSWPTKLQRIYWLHYGVLPGTGKPLQHKSSHKNQNLNLERHQPGVRHSRRNRKGQNCGGYYHKTRFYLLLMKHVLANHNKTPFWPRKGMDRRYDRTQLWGHPGFYSSRCQVYILTLCQKCDFRITTRTQTAHLASKI